MRVIEVKTAVVEAGSEINAMAYPGPGVYLGPSGTSLYAVSGGVAYSWPLPPGLHLSEIQGSDSGCDPHRLLDRVIEIQKGGRP